MPQDRQDSDWRETPLTDLVDHVIDTHHAYLNQSLPELSKLMTTVLRDYGAKHKELSKIHQLFHRLKTDMESHLIDEEEVIFPLVKDYERQDSTIALSKAVSIIKRQEQQHQEAEKVLQQLKEITQDYAVPDGASTTHSETYRRLKELENDISRHLHLEDNILFPRLKEELMRVQNLSSTT